MPKKHIESPDQRKAYDLISEAKVTGNLDPAEVEAEAGRLYFVEDVIVK